jgi:membrane-associated HD superfamily phosphohydrolase
MKTSTAKAQSLLFGLLLVLSLACFAGIIFFFVRMYQRDMQALTDFMASYHVYDQALKAISEPVSAINGVKTPAAGEEERRADAALSDLKTKSSAQISSLIKNEKEAMRVMREIADLSDKEMSALKAYQESSAQDTNEDALAQAFHDLTKERQAAFAHFQELGR